MHSKYTRKKTKNKEEIKNAGKNKKKKTDQKEKETLGVNKYKLESKEIINENLKNNLEETEIISTLDNWIKENCHYEKKENVIKIEEKRESTPLDSKKPLLEVTSIKEYIEYNKNLLKEHKITLNQYLEKIDVDDEKMVQSLNILLESNNHKEFYEKYNFFQFKLKLISRLYFQNKFTQKNLPDSIKKNIIKSDNIKLIFKKNYLML